HLGYKKIDIDYVHPSWNNDGEAVTGLDLCFLPMNENKSEIQADLVAEFLIRYYTVLPNKPESWTKMVAEIESKDQLALLNI
ncbi:MAG TPA: GNAT family N-acetyltransferase, partial [Metabacillus sp.]|nr:GNAT family N-acetyltransferase [Metabacillus sp.]